MTKVISSFYNKHQPVPSYLFKNKKSNAFILTLCTHSLNVEKYGNTELTFERGWGKKGGEEKWEIKYV